MRNPGPRKWRNPLVVTNSKGGADIFLFERNFRRLECLVDGNAPTGINGYFPVELWNIIVSNNLGTFAVRKNPYAKKLKSLDKLAYGRVKRSRTCSDWGSRQNILNGFNSGGFVGGRHFKQF